MVSIKCCCEKIYAYIHHSLGITVHYSAEVGGIEPGDALLRCLLLLWTGDYPAQSEVGKFVCSGIHPCRRCTLEGVC